MLRGVPARQPSRQVARINRRPGKRRPGVREVGALWRYDDAQCGSFARRGTAEAGVGRQSPHHESSWQSRARARSYGGTAASDGVRRESRHDGPALRRPCFASERPYWNVLCPVTAGASPAAASRRKSDAGSGQGIKQSTELLYQELWARAYALFESGDVVAADRVNDEFGRWGEERNRPFTIYLVAVFRAARAAMSGRFEDSERLAQQALAIGPARTRRGRIRNLRPADVCVAASARPAQGSRADRPDVCPAEFCRRRVASGTGGDLFRAGAD